jgi:hypothetical protein
VWCRRNSRLVLEFSFAGCHRVTVSPFLGLNARKREAWGLPHVSSSSDAATFQAAGRTSLFLRAFSPELEGFVFFGLRAACCRYRGASLLASKFDRRTGSPTTPIRPQKLSSRLLRRKAAAGCSSPRCFAPKCPNHSLRAEALIFALAGLQPENSGRMCGRYRTALLNLATFRAASLFGHSAATRMR